MTTRDSLDSKPVEERVEQLLADSAGWEPDEPAPIGLAYSALSRMEQEQEPRRRRRAAGRVALWAGFFLGAGACCASLVMALTTTNPHSQDAATSEPPVRPPASVSTSPAREPVHTVEDMSPRFVVPPVSRRRSPVRLTSGGSRHRSGAPRFRREEPSPLLRTQWVDHRVSEEVDGVMASGWVAEPLSGGDVRISPIVIDVPTRSQASAEVPASQVEPISPASSPGIEGVNR